MNFVSVVVVVAVEDVVLWLWSVLCLFCVCVCFPNTMFSVPANGMGNRCAYFLLLEDVKFYIDHSA